MFRLLAPPLATSASRRLTFLVIVGCCAIVGSAFAVAVVQLPSKPGYANSRRGQLTRALHATSSASPTPPTSSSSNKKTKKLYKFDEARRMARQYGFTCQQEYVEYECPGAYQLPKDPHEVYQDEWAGWDDYLGLPWAFDEGRTLARSLKVASKEEYLECWQSPRIREDPNLARLPYRPDLYYGKGGAWIGWEDWLGVSQSPCDNESAKDA